MTRNVLAVMVLTPVMLAACSMATVVHREPYSGVIELQGDRGDAMKKAKAQMAAHCGADNYTVVSEGYEPAWRVHYQCNNAPAGYQAEPQYPQQTQYPQQPQYPDPNQQPYPQQPDPNQQPYPQQPQPYPQQPQPYPQQPYPQR